MIPFGPMSRYELVMNQQKTLIVTTGGTIEKTYDESDGSLSNRETVIKNTILERLRLPNNRIDVKSIMAKDSLDMDNQDRVIIRQALSKFSEYKNPIVVLHGTDTMQQTIEVCCEQKWEVPIIFTGAMRPLGFVNSDAIQNVTEALMATSLVEPGVYLSFHGKLFPGPSVRKNKQSLTFESF